MTPDRLLSAIRAALDDTERLALAATPGPWTAHGLPYERLDDPSIVAADGRWVAGLAYDGLSTSVEHEVDADAEHIARHDPAAILRWVAAMREIVAMYEAMLAGAEAAEGTILARAARVRLGAYEQVLRALARGLGIDPEEQTT